MVIKKITIFIFLSLVIVFICSAQTEDFYLHGFIADSQTKESIPYSSISILNTTRGTACDGKGEFNLLIKNRETKLFLKVSSIGYKSITLPIDSLLKFEVSQILLQPDVYQLNEIEIKHSRINPIEILQNAIDSFSKNYKQDAFNAEYYSKLQAENISTNEKYVIETLIFGYYQGYAISTDKKFEILNKRTFGNNHLSATDYPYWPTLEIHRADLIADPVKTGVFQKDNWDKFDFKYIGLSFYDADTVYTIEYSALKPTKKLTGYAIVPKVYKGLLWITTSNHAIVKHEIITDQFEYSIIYKKFNDYYFPYLFYGTRKLSGANIFTKVTNLIRLTNLSFSDVKQLQKTNEFQNLDQIPEDKEFWKMYYPTDK